MFARLPLLVLLLSAFSFAQDLVPRRMTAEEIRQYDPPGVGIHDDANQAIFTQNFLVANRAFLVPAPRFEEALRGKPREEAAQLRNARAEIDRQAMNLLGRLRGTIGITENQLFETCEENPGNLIAALVKKVEDDRQREDCANIPLPVGGVTRFSHQGRLQLPAYHVLKRTSETSYQATLNLNVTDATEPGGGEGMLAKIRGCMTTIRPYLKGPEGKTLDIRIVTPGEANALPEAERPNPYNINVTHANIRGDASNYTNKFECDTITHEILHLLGLCDEYLENGAFTAGWNCRIVPAGNTTMAQHSEQFNAVVPKATRCRCNTEACQGTFRLPPAALERVAQASNPCDQIGGQFLDVSYGPGQENGINNGVITIVNTPTKQSLLTDVHFKKIISGYCARESGGYDQCSQYSQISREDPRCRDIPPECNDPAYFRGVSY